MKKLMFFIVCMFLVVGCEAPKSLEANNDVGVQENGPELNRDLEFIPGQEVSVCYPAEAVKSRLEGYCVVEFSVTLDGRTSDIKVVDCPERVFEDCAIRAAQQFKYIPKVKNGELVTVQGIKNKFVFEGLP